MLSFVKRLYSLLYQAFMKYTKIDFLFNINFFLKVPIYILQGKIEIRVVTWLTELILILLLVTNLRA